MGSDLLQVCGAAPRHVLTTSSGTLGGGGGRSCYSPECFIAFAVKTARLK